MNKCLIVLLISPILLMGLHIIAIHLINSLKLNISEQKSLIGLELLLNIPVLTIIYLFTKDFYSVFYGFIVYNSLGYCYFHFFNMSETARRIKILLEIKTRQSVGREELQSFYKSDLMIKNRLDRLIGINQIKKQGDKYILSGKVLWFGAKIIHTARKILGFAEI